MNMENTKLVSPGQAHSAGGMVSDRLMEWGASRELVRKWMETPTHPLWAEMKRHLTLSPIDGVICRLQTEEDEAASTQQEFAKRVNAVVSEFTGFIKSNEGKKALQLLRLTSRAVVIAYKMTGGSFCTKASYDSYQLQFDGFDHEYSTYEMPLRGSNPGHGPGCGKNNLLNKETVKTYILEFCKVDSRKPEEFLPHIRREIENIAVTT